MRMTFEKIEMPRWLYEEAKRNLITHPSFKSLKLWKLFLLKHNQPSTGWTIRGDDGIPLAKASGKEYRWSNSDIEALYRPFDLDLKIINNF